MESSVCVFVCAAGHECSGMFIYWGSVERKKLSSLCASEKLIASPQLQLL